MMKYNFNFIAYLSETKTYVTPKNDQRPDLWSGYPRLLIQTSGQGTTLGKTRTGHTLPPPPDRTWTERTLPPGQDQDRMYAPRGQTDRSL